MNNNNNFIFADHNDNTSLNGGEYTLTDEMAHTMVVEAKLAHLTTKLNEYKAYLVTQYHMLSMTGFTNPPPQFGTDEVDAMIALLPED
jgi:hypothetical protein